MEDLPQILSVEHQGLPLSWASQLHSHLQDVCFMNSVQQALPALLPSLCCYYNLHRRQTLWCEFGCSHLTSLALEMSRPSANLSSFKDLATATFSLNGFLICTVSSRISVACVVVLNVPFEVGSSIYNHFP